MSAPELLLGIRNGMRMSTTLAPLFSSSFLVTPQGNRKPDYFAFHAFQ